MPSDPIARWESEGGSILAIERLRPAAKSSAPRHMADGSVASPPEISEALRFESRQMAPRPAEQASS